MTDYTRPEGAEFQHDSEAFAGDFSQFASDDWPSLRSAIKVLFVAPQAEKLAFPDGPANFREKPPADTNTYQQQPRDVQQRIDDDIDELTSDDPLVRQAAQQELSQFGHAAAQRLVLRLGSDSITEREAAERQLTRMGDKAVPALYAAPNKSTSAEQRARAKSTLNSIVEVSHESTFRDSAGHIRRVVDEKTRDTLLDASYTEKDEVAEATIRGARFTRRKDGTYTRSDCKGEFTNVKVTAVGGLQFSSPEWKVSVEWATDGRTLVYNGDGKLTTIVLWDGRTIEVENQKWQFRDNPWLR